ncbi:MAG: SH3 domain-containing protein [Gammaproteobacteria bacterium]|jgi:uncharacterized protein YgiM (DUF1202 family)
MKITTGTKIFSLAAVAAIVPTTLPAAAQPIDVMLNACSSTGQKYFGDYTARTDMQYNGQRVDGTYAINGDIYLEARKGSFACSFDRSGQRMIEFYADGRQHNDYLPGGGHSGSSSGTSGLVQVRGVPSNDVLNVRSGPGTGHRIVGALGNGDSVRELRCEHHGGTRWCEIEMQTDMRERGWVNARYLGK